MERGHAADGEFAAGDELAREVPNPTSDFQHLAAAERADDVGHPGVETRRAGEARQNLAAIRVLAIDGVAEGKSGDGGQRAEPVAPVDLLAVRVGAAGVADRQLVDARTP